MKFRLKTYLSISLLLLLSFSLHSQEQSVADSLRQIYQTDTLSGDDEFELLIDLSFNETNDLNLALSYAEELITLAENSNYNFFLFQGYFQKGNVHRLLGNLEDALAAYFKAADIANSEEFIDLEGSAYGAIADVYSVSENSENAMLYYRKAISVLRNAEDQIELASYIMNAGDEFLLNQEYDSALIYFEESGQIFEELDHLIGKAYNLGNIGIVYANLGNNELAQTNINEAITLFEKTQDYYGISSYLLFMVDIYVQKGDLDLAIEYAKRSFVLGEFHGLKEQASDAGLKLSELYEIEGNMSESLNYFKKHIKYQDSLKNIQSVQAMANLRTDFEVSQKQLEVDLEKKNRRIITISTSLIIVFIGALLFSLFKRYEFVKKTNRIIALEKDKSESLLLNILPEETADELKKQGTVEAKKIDSASVLFTDFVGFTRLSGSVEPEKLIKDLDKYFGAFDEITTKYELEKIKTIGDSYMCAGGLPTENRSHAINVVKAAIEMVKCVEQLHQTSGPDFLRFSVRVGIHTGPVIAGIVGKKKWQYDIWGDTVNLASRMESNSEAGRINLSHETYLMIKDEFDCIYRGEIDVRNGGNQKMYFLNFE